MSAFMVSNTLMAKVVTAILLNLDTFDREGTCRVALLAAPTDAQKEGRHKDRRKSCAPKSSDKARLILDAPERSRPSPASGSPSPYQRWDTRQSTAARL
jgi:hypothetical protein